MDNRNFQGLILDAIDQLRKRKARPDLTKISYMLSRRHGLKSAEVNEELQRLVSENIVIKVDYKGNTSYRNAAKWVRTKNLFLGNYCSGSDLSSLLHDAISALTPAEAADAPAGKEKGVPLLEIENYLFQRDTQDLLNSEKIRDVLEKEVSNGVIKHMPDGGYFLKKPICAGKSPNCQLTESSVANTSATKTNPQQPFRPASTRKRFKKTHGPDFVDTSYVVPTDSPGEIRCDYCLLSANANINGEPEDLLVCKDCNAKAHPSCMDYTAELAARSQLSPWQCTDCKTCTVCEDSGDGDIMLFCDLCDKGYHMNCHNPPVSTKPIGKWVCSSCKTNNDDDDRKKREPGESSLKMPRFALQILPNSGNRGSDKVKNRHLERKISQFMEECLRKYPDVVPPAENWTIADVEMFFSHIGYKEEAPAFREQEIDGQSLLLMKRNDVLTGLALKLGPALKIYNHVKKLQSRVPSRFAS